MKNKKLVVAIVSALAIGGGIYYYYSEPYFHIIQLDKKDHSGTFVFDGIENYFSLHSKGMYYSKNGIYSVEAQPEGNMVVFRLFKKGKLIKELTRV